MKGLKCTNKTTHGKIYWLQYSLALLLIGFLSLFYSNSVSAVDINYSQATVDFYTNQQRNATVNLPWSVNPGTNQFYLNNVYIDENSYNNNKLSYISGRAVLQLEPKATTNVYICGKSATFGLGSNSVLSECLGSITINYTDGNQTKKQDLSAYIIESTTPYNYRIYFDFNTPLESDKTISFIQFRFYGRQGYDVFSRNTNWNNTELVILASGRSSITAYDTPPTSVDLSNELLQQQIGQNQTMIDQNNQTNNLLQQQNQQQQNQYEQEKDEEQEREQDATDSQNGNFLGTLNNLLFPFSGMFTTLGQQGCFTPTNLNNWLGTTGQYCAWFPTSITNAVSSVLLALSTIITFGFTIKWLRKEE